MVEIFRHYCILDIVEAGRQVPHGPYALVPLFFLIYLLKVKCCKQTCFHQTYQIVRNWNVYVSDSIYSFFILEIILHTILFINLNKEVQQAIYILSFQFYGSNF